MSDVLTEGAINRLTAAVLACAEAQYHAKEYDPQGRGATPDLLVEEDYERWLDFILDGDE